MRQPFDGLRVLDLTHVLAGPFCAYQLGVLGADVIKIEPPLHPDASRGRGPDDTLNAEGLGINYLVQGSNKRAIALDLKTEKGRDLFLKLVATADVVLENYRTGALAALGLGAATLLDHNPRLVHCSMTGYGHDTEREAVNAYDNVIQAASGLMARTGNKTTGPLKAGASLVDYASGYNAAFAIAAALLQRERSGKGQVIDCAMLDTALVLMAPECAASLYEGPATQRPKEAGLGTYETADGLIMLGAFNTRQNARLWTALGREDFAALTTWDEIWQMADPMRLALREIFKTRSAAQWESYLHEIGVPAERVRSLDEAVRMPHLQQRRFLHTLPASSPGTAPVTVPVAAFSYAEAGPSITRAPPRFGEQTDQILAELGLTPSEIASLRDSRVVA